MKPDHTSRSVDARDGGIRMDAIDALKEQQKKLWEGFAPIELVTTIPAARLVKFAQVRSGMRVLDVGCGTGVVALTAAQMGAQVCGLDLTPALLERARESAALCGLDVDWREGDAEALPYEDESFDLVLSQFGHMFAPRPQVAAKELLRVLKPGGTVAFSTWPPELFVGRMFALSGRYLPPPPPGVSSPERWGDITFIRDCLGDGVTEITFDRDRMLFPTVSPQMHRRRLETTVGPIKRVADLLQGDRERLAAFRREYDALVAEYHENNAVRQDFLMTRAIKR